MVVENLPGAGNILGLQTLARSGPDGHTPSVVPNNVVIFPSVLKSLPFDMPGDFTPIAGSDEFFAALKARPGDYDFGSLPTSCQMKRPAR